MISVNLSLFLHYFGCQRNIDSLIFKILVEFLIIIQTLSNSVNSILTFKIFKILITISSDGFIE